VFLKRAADWIATARERKGLAVPAKKAADEPAAPEPEEVETTQSTWFSDSAVAIFLALMLVPLIMIGAVAGLGHLLQAIEGWNVHQGFWYTASNMAGLGNPLVRSSPTSDLGQIVDSVVSIWILILGGIMLSMISQTSLVRFFCGLSLFSAYAARVGDAPPGGHAEARPAPSTGPLRPHPRRRLRLHPPLQFPSGLARGLDVTIFRKFPADRKSQFSVST